MSLDNLIVGETYNVRHSRKGAFTLKVTSVEAGGAWVTGKIIDGYAASIKGGVYADTGEDVTVRVSFLSYCKKVSQ